MSILRLFIGISLSPEVSSELSSLMDRMAAQLPFKRWTHPDDLHVTLHFLGDTPPERADAVRQAVEETAAETAPIRFKLTSPGTFGPPNSPRVLWCGVSEPDAPGALADLHGKLIPRLLAAGCEVEDRPFRAHVTMARQGGAGVTREDIDAAWQAASSPEAALSWKAGHLTLFHSRLGQRPSYERLQESEFKG
jgi:2'-5' RNA ligase